MTGCRCHAAANHSADDIHRHHFSIYWLGGKAAPTRALRAVRTGYEQEFVAGLLLKLEHYRGARCSARRQAEKSGDPGLLTASIAELTIADCPRGIALLLRDVADALGFGAGR